MTQALPRLIARALMRHAARVMPSGEKNWGAAMQNELQVIEDDHVALNWAIGCVIVGYGERMNALLQTWYARAALALLIGVLALREFFAPLLILAYRTQELGLAHFLGLRTAGDDYRRLIPLMDATPAWLPLLWWCSESLEQRFGSAVLRNMRALSRRKPGPRQRKPPQKQPAPRKAPAPPPVCGSRHTAAALHTSPCQSPSKTPSRTRLQLPL